jgi:hypothetical protein
MAQVVHSHAKCSGGLLYGQHTLIHAVPLFRLASAAPSTRQTSQPCASHTVNSSRVARRRSATSAVCGVRVTTVSR